MSTKERSINSSGPRRSREIGRRAKQNPPSSSCRPGRKQAVLRLKILAYCRPADFVLGIS